MFNPEILPVKDRTTVQNQTDNHSSAWSKAASDAYDFAASGVNSVGRELRLLGQGVIWGGIKEGYDAFTKNTKSTMVHLAETVGIGAAIGIAAKAGPAPLRLLAAGAGGYFGYQMQDWIKKDVLDAGRWSRIGGAMSDAWSTNANMDRNLATMQKDAGLLAFDTTLMIGGGVAGYKLGSGAVKLSSRLDARSLKSGGRAETVLETAAVTETARLNADLKKGEVADPFAKADQIVKSKKGEVTKHGLEGLQEAVREARMRELGGKDEIARDLRDVKIPEVARQNVELQRTIDGLGVELKAKNADLKAAETLSTETRALREAETRLSALEQDAAGLGAKKAELASLERQISEQGKAKEEAKKRGGTDDAAAKKGKGEEKAEGEVTEKVDIKAQARELRAEIKEKEAATDRSKPTSAISQATAARDAARSTLETATQGQTARVEGLKGEIGGIEAKITEHTQSKGRLAEQMQGLVDSYYGRLSELMADPAVLRLAKPAEVTEVKTGRQTKAQREGGTEVEGEGMKARADRAGHQQVEKGGTVVSSEAKAAARTSELAGADGGKGKGGTGTGEVKTETREVKSETKEVKRDAIAPEEMVRLEAAGKAKVALDNASPLVKEARERLQAIDQASTAKKNARQSLDQATTELANIESGKTKFTDEAVKTRTIEELQAKQEKARKDIEAAQDAIKKVGSGQYFQAMRSIRRYAQSVEEYFAKETDNVRRHEFAREAAKHLEDLMDGLPKSRQGVRPPMDNLSRRGFTGKEMERISQISEHLNKRLEQMDNKHDARLSRVANMGAVKTAFESVTSGELRTQLPEFIRERLAESQNRLLTGEKPERVPGRSWTNIQETARKVDVAKLAAEEANVSAVLKESTVVFFDQHGKLIGHVGTDGKFRPKYFDVAAIQNGTGRGGAGIDRLLGENPVGYAVLGPKARLSFGGRMELHQIGTNSKGAPVFNKEVIVTGGKVPESVTRGTPANRLSSPENRGGQRRRGGTAGDGRTAATETKPESAA